MIVKIVPRRKDGRTDFKQLKDYLTDGLTARGADVETHSFDTLTQYITADDVFDGLGDKVEKTLAVEIGNLHSLATAGAEMWAVANQNTRCKDPVLHYILSWPEHERPSVDEIFGAARHTLKALGLLEHQYVIAIHVNTENIHAHIEVNRVHPETYKSQHIEWAHKTLHKAAREAELMYGWSHDPGLWEVVEIDGKKMVVPNARYVDPDVEAGLSSRAKNFEAWTGTESLETWCRGAPAVALQKALNDKRLTSWSAIHQTLAEFGLTLVPSGGGGYKVYSGKDTPDETVVAASKAFRFLKPAQLEKQIGPYVAPSAEDLAGKPPQAERTYKRDPVKRALRREERREARDLLFQRFTAERNAAIALRDKAKAHFKKQQADLEKRHFAAMAKKYAAERERLKADASVPPSQKQPLYSLMKLQYEQAVKEQRAAFGKARREFSAMLPAIPSWRTWVTAEAALGDEAAISALRGIVYRDRREGKDTDAGAETDVDALSVVAQQQPSIKPHPQRVYDDPLLVRASALTWSVTSNGRIVYSFKGNQQRPAFIDGGPSLSFIKDTVDDDALRAALLHARQKWGPTLRLDGGDRIFRERVARMALELGYRLENRDLREFQKTLLEVTPTHAPQSLHRRSERSTDEVIGQLLHDRPEVTYRPADRTRAYAGKILAITDTHVIQEAAKGQLILHENQFMRSMPKVGKAVTIRYHVDGMATHQAKTRRGR